MEALPDSLQKYCIAHPGMHLLPLGAARCMSALRALMKGGASPMLVLASDVEYIPRARSSVGDVAISPDEQCFTLPVQFELIEAPLLTSSGLGNW